MPRNKPNWCSQRASWQAGCSPALWQSWVLSIQVTLSTNHVSCPFSIQLGSDVWAGCFHIPSFFFFFLPYFSICRLLDVCTAVGCSACTRWHQPHLTQLLWVPKQPCHHRVGVSASWGVPAHAAITPLDGSVHIGAGRGTGRSTTHIWATAVGTKASGLAASASVCAEDVLQSTVKGNG